MAYQYRQWGGLKMRPSANISTFQQCCIVIGWKVGRRFTKRGKCAPWWFLSIGRKSEEKNYGTVITIFQLLISCFVYILLLFFCCVLGKGQSEEALNQRLENIAINQCSTLVYTSGTTGNPKGVMLSHDNIYWTTLVASDFIQMRESTEVLVSYLPLSHVAGKDFWRISKV